MPNVFEQNAEERAEHYAMDAEGYSPPIGPPPEMHPDDSVDGSRIVAVFKGENGSMGFMWNQRYELLVRKSSVKNIEGGPWVPYGSLAAFFRNWIVIGGK